MTVVDDSARVRLDLNGERFQVQLFSLDAPQSKAASRCLRRLLTLTWQQVLDDHGLNWERIKGSDARYSIRLSLQARAVVTRAGDVMRFESLHFDHDSAYK